MKNWLQKIKTSMKVETILENNNKGLFIPNRQVSWIVLILFSSIFVTFMLGYFWGHKRALDRFVAKLEEESFADRINYALYTMNDRDSSEFEQDQDQDENVPQEQDDTEKLKEDQDEIENTETDPGSDNIPTTTDLIESKNVSLNVKEEKKFFAPIIGFGTLKKAQEFVKTIQYIDPSAFVETKVSKNSKGRTITWYQAITGEFSSKEELEKVLKRLRKEAHIKSIEIVEKRKG